MLDFTHGTISGTNIVTKEEVAIKLECIKTRHPQLHIESKFYKLMQGGGKCLLCCLVPIGLTSMVIILLVLKLSILLGKVDKGRVCLEFRKHISRAF